MSPRLRMTVAVVLAALTMTACEDLEIFLDLFEPTDLATSEDPAVAAAAAAEQADRDRREAERIVDDVLARGGSAADMAEARRLRPDDAAISTTQFWLAYIDSDRATMKEAGDASFNSFAVTVGQDERRWMEHNLEAMADVLTNLPTPPPDSPRVGRLDDVAYNYCLTLDQYRQQFGDQFEAQVFLTFANPRDC